jgi:hypothetical protein
LPHEARATIKPSPEPAAKNEQVSGSGMHHDAVSFMILPAWGTILTRWDDVKIGPSEKRNTMPTRQIMVQTNAKRIVMNIGRFSVFILHNTVNVPTMTTTAPSFSNIFNLPAYVIQKTVIVLTS